MGFSVNGEKNVVRKNNAKIHGWKAFQYFSLFFGFYFLIQVELPKTLQNSTFYKLGLLLVICISFIAICKGILHLIKYTKDR
ncbi:hypothetical protein ACPA2L_25850 [Bacillus bombysepticus]